MPEDEQMPTTAARSIQGPTAGDDEEGSVQQANFTPSRSVPQQALRTRLKPLESKKKLLDLGIDSPAAEAQQPPSARSLPAQPRQPVMDDEEGDDKAQEDSWQLPVRKEKTVSMRR
jgi:hypothetical protein